MKIFRDVPCLHPLYSSIKGKTPISLKLILPYFEKVLTQTCGVFWDYKEACVTRPPSVCANRRLDWTRNVLANSSILLLCVFVTVHKKTL